LGLERGDRGESINNRVNCIVPNVNCGMCFSDGEFAFTGYGYGMGCIYVGDEGIHLYCLCCAIEKSIRLNIQLNTSRFMTCCNFEGYLINFATAGTESDEFRSLYSRFQRYSHKASHSPPQFLHIE